LISVHDAPLSVDKNMPAEFPANIDLSRRVYVATPQPKGAQKPGVLDPQVSPKSVEKKPVNNVAASTLLPFTARRSMSTCKTSVLETHVSPASVDWYKPVTEKLCP
jgi:hypothetical protein